MYDNLKRGFGPLLIIIIIAIVAAIGGGVYYSSKKNSQLAEIKTNTQAETEVKGSGTTNASTTTSVGVDIKTGTLRDILAIGKDVRCTVQTVDTDTDTLGTVYISGAQMRGDFISQTKASGVIESHLIKNSADVIVWSGTQGMTMNLDTFDQQSKTSTNTQSSVNLDQKVSYQCSDWTKDDSKFKAPINIKIIDLNAMLNGQVKASGTVKP